MAYLAAIFDLYGTLVPGFSRNEHRRVLNKMAAVLGAPAKAFSKQWVATFDQRCMGMFGTVEANILHICSGLGVRPTSQAVEAARLIRFGFAQRCLVPISGTLEALTIIKRAGLKTGLISDCSIETVKLWPTCPLSALMDEVIFSYEVGMKKPDPRIYHAVCERLKVKPGDCIYIGDGGSRELSGARAVGMHAVLLQSDMDETDVFRVDGERWDGPRLQKLLELIPLFTLASQ